ncbi:MAG: DUF2946 domain-containing protein [Kiritimatiellia bacterium]
MHSLRSAKNLARLVLVWFALSLGAAVASPLIKPQAMELVCSGSGAMKLLVKSDDGSKDASSFTLDCPLCATSSAPPPPDAQQSAEPMHALAHVLQGIAAAHIASLTAAPLPARGPPAFS